MKLKGIVAMDKHGGIGLKDGLPWGSEHNDLKHFKEMTIGGVVIMGRKTFESIGRPLPHRTNIVLSRTMAPTDGVIVVKSVMDLQRELVVIPHTKAFVIGGSEIYNLLAPHIVEWHITKHDEAFECDTFFDISSIPQSKIKYHKHEA